MKTTTNISSSKGNYRRSKQTGFVVSLLVLLLFTSSHSSLAFRQVTTTAGSRPSSLLITTTTTGSLIVANPKKLTTTTIYKYLQSKKTILRKSKLFLISSTTTTETPIEKQSSTDKKIVSNNPSSRRNNNKNNNRMVELKNITKDAFKDKTILITGASGGLGSALARALATCQPSVIVLSGRREDALQQVVTECKAIALAETTVDNTNNDPSTIQQQQQQQPIFHILTCDLEDPMSVDQLAITALEKCGGTVDVLINNGGVSSRGTFIDTSIEVDRRVMQINFFSGVALSKAFVPSMIIKKFGRIIWISSVQGLVGIPSRSSYAASKFAVQGYTESIRGELHTAGVKVHTVSPGYIRTNLSRSALKADGTASGVMDPTAEAGADPDDVAVELLDRVVAGQMDFKIAATFSAVLAIWFRLLFPDALRSQLIKRFDKEQQQRKELQQQQQVQQNDTDPKTKKNE